VTRFADKLPPGTRISANILAWFVAPAICLAAYWAGLWCWFHTDDLSLLFLVRLPPEEFWPTMLEPRAQGTFRPLSERLFFYLFHGWFGFNAFPYRSLVFATHFANLALLTLLTKQLSGKLSIGVFAASLWTVHHGLAVSLSWSSAYNQILCSFFMLAGLVMFSRFTAGAGWGWYAAQVATFIGGLGSLETAAVYPLLCLALGIVNRQKRALWALPLLAVSALFGRFQVASAEGLGGSIYTLSLHPSSVLANLWWYVREAITPAPGAPYVLLCGLALFTLAALHIWTKNRAVVFGLCWFLITLAPYLIFEGRQAHYYLAIPVAGLAMFLAGSLNWQNRLPQLVIGVTLLVSAVIASQSLELGRTIAAHNYRSGLAARNLLSGVAHGRRLHPNKTILLTDVDQSVFYGSVYHGIFQLAGIYDVFLTPDGNAIIQLPGYRSIDSYFVTARDARLMSTRGTAVVYSAGQARLREITSKYRATLNVRLGPPGE
jgi:hypothetical protein